MRYYSLTIKDKDGKLWTPPSFSADMLGGASYASFVKGTSFLPAAAGGRTFPAAWDIELDVPAIGSATPQGFAMVTVWGVSIQEIAQAQNLVGKNMEIAVGFQKGLPLAKPEQAGTIFEGMILQCFGNWIGSNMTLDFVVVPGPATPSQIGGQGFVERARNFTLSWEGGKPLGPALKKCLETAFPGYTVNDTTSDKIVRPQKDTITGPYSTLGSLASDVRQMSLDIVDPNRTTGYPGVTIIISGKTITVADSPQGDAVDIAFEDLIGQPTWIENPRIQIKTAMRGDLRVLQPFNLPKNNVSINTAAAASSIVNQRLTFQGGFQIVSMRHVGAYRNPAADAWVTIIEGLPQKSVLNEFNPGSSQFAIF